ncbi:MAG: hypothetical protein ABSB15_20280 [Bryobacteraceae bacterium]|jgi:hypothetical protein
MNVRFWRRPPRLSDSSTASNTADRSALAGVSPSDPWVEQIDRRAAKFSLLAKISAWSVVGGILLEDWDIIGMAWRYHFPYLIREGIGGLLVAIAIALEVRFSSLEASAERQIRDRYTVRIAELNLKAEQEHTRRVNLERHMLGRDLTQEQVSALKEKLSAFRGQHVHIVKALDLSESIRFAGRIWATLKACGWDSVDSVVKPQNRLPMPGLHVFATRDDASQRAAKALGEAFRSIGVFCLPYTLVTHGFIMDDRWHVPFWPPGLYDSGDNLVLVVVNDMPPLDLAMTEAPPPECPIHGEPTKSR